MISIKDNKQVLLIYILILCFVILFNTFFGEILRYLIISLIILALVYYLNSTNKTSLENNFSINKLDNTIKSTNLQVSHKDKTPVRNLFKYNKIYTEFKTINRLYIQHVNRLYKSNSIIKNALTHIERFYKIYTDFNEKRVLNLYLFEEAKLRRLESLNELMTIFVESNFITEVEHKLKKSIQTIRQLTKKYLTEMEIYLNHLWNTGDITYLSGPAYLDKVTSNVYSDVLFSNRFNIY